MTLMAIRWYPQILGCMTHTQVRGRLTLQLFSDILCICHCLALEANISRSILRRCYSQDLMPFCRRNIARRVVDLLCVDSPDQGFGYEETDSSVSYPHLCCDRRSLHHMVESSSGFEHVHSDYSITLED